MEVEDINLIKGFHQVLTHLSVSNAIDKGIIRDIGEDSFIIFLDK